MVWKTVWDRYDISDCERVWVGGMGCGRLGVLKGDIQKPPAKDKLSIRVYK